MSSKALSSLTVVVVLAGCDGEPLAAPSDAEATVIDTGARPDSAGVTEASGSAADRVGLLSLNLHCLETGGTEFQTNEARLAAVADLAAAEDVVAVLLQEACEDDGTVAVDLLADALDVATGVTWDRAWASAHTAWEGTADEAEEGLAVLARGDLGDLETLTYQEQGGLVRVAVLATLPAELGGLRLVTIHLDHDDESAREAQARETAVAALVGADPGLDVVVMGDLNALEGSATHDAFLAAGFNDATASLEAGRIDHAFVHRGAGWVATTARLVFEGEAEPVVSDHPGVLVHLESAPPESLIVTRITAPVDVGWGHYLAVRGDTAPLVWDAGWPLANVDGAWTFLTTELPGSPFAYKLLLDDETWQQGADLEGTGGEEHEVVPTF